jgi:hypothetical protein
LRGPRRNAEEKESITMLVQSPDWFRPLLEGVQVIAGAVLLVVLVRAGRRYPEISTASWQWVVAGFAMILLASLVDFTDEIFNFSATYMPNLFATFISRGGMIAGLVLAALGFSTWFEFMARFLGLKPRK